MHYQLSNEHSTLLYSNPKDVNYKNDLIWIHLAWILLKLFEIGYDGELLVNTKHYISVR